MASSTASGRSPLPPPAGFFGQVQAERTDAAVQVEHRVLDLDVGIHIQNVVESLQAAGVDLEERGGLI